MAPPFLTLDSGNVIDLQQRRGHHRPAHVIDERSVVAINAALAAGRPLLVRGEPGVGKSQLAHAAAVRLERRFLAHVVDASTEARDLLYTIDAVARLAEAQLLGALGKDSGAEGRARVALANFVRPGALWWAFDWDSAVQQARRSGEAPEGGDGGGARDQGVVLLIDEIDKADSAVPNALLDALGRGTFAVPGGGRVEMHARPLVVITTNEERSLPDAFLRRCLVLRLGLPEDNRTVRDLLQGYGEAHFPGCKEESSEILVVAAGLIADRRSTPRREHVPPPGVAEYIDLVNAVLEQQAADPSVDALALLRRISEFVLDKHAAPDQGA
jgi:MoxR-like ATPase